MRLIFARPLKKAVSLCLLLRGFCELPAACAHQNLPGLTLQRVNFQNLPLWSQSNLKNSVEALKKSCAAIQKAKNPQQAIVGTGIFPVTQSDWRRICASLGSINTNHSRQTHAFFEKHFQPIAVRVNGDASGLFTGYYLPEIPASLIRTSVFHYPIYGRPYDLEVNTDKNNRKHYGATRQGHFSSPYPFSRAQINQGLLFDKAPILAWAKDPVDLFFLHIQGSGMLKLPKGESVLVGYNGANGQPYYPIGHWFVDRHIFTPEKISMQVMRTWLRQHPQSIAPLLNRNAAYVFFKKLALKAPLGTEQVPLTSEYSLAVDTHFIPLGLPLWLYTRLPNQQVFAHLMIAQDTGGAIKGAIRGDIYFGSGKRAEHIAGTMKSSGQYWALVPKFTLIRILAKNRQ